MSATHDIEPWDALLETGRADERLVHDDRYESRAARLVSIPEELNWNVSQALEQAGIQHLYAHQAEALQKAFSGPTIVTTGTISTPARCRLSIAFNFTSKRFPTLRCAFAAFPMPSNCRYA